MKTFNIKFPSEDNKDLNSFYQMNKTTEEGIVSNLYFLLLTKKGERYYMPEFGTDLIRFIFEPNDSENIADIKKSIKKDVAKFIPELTITTINFNNEAENRNENKLTVQIGFRFNDSSFSNDGSIELEF